jgi:transposase
MPRPYSVVFRPRAIEAVAGGGSRHEAAECFEASPRTVLDWLRRWRDHRGAEAMPSEGSEHAGYVRT